MADQVEEVGAAPEETRLLAEQAQLQTEIAHLQEQVQQEVDAEPDEGDPAFFEREKSAALMAVLQRRLQGVEQALRALENGSYGVCGRCGEAIDPGRLEVKPDATLCLSCQREVEAAARRGRSRPAPRW